MSMQLMKLPALPARQLNRTLVGAQRQFTSTTIRQENDAGNSWDGNNDERGLDESGRQHMMSKLVEGVYKQSSPPSSAQGPEKFQGGRKEATSQQPRRPPRNKSGPVDARSFRAGAPQDGPNASKRLLRSTSMKNPQSRNRLQRMGGNLMNAASALRSSAPHAERRGGRKPRRNKEFKDEQEPYHEEVVDYLNEQQEKARPRPIRYSPDPYTFKKLSRTWPSLPVGQNAHEGNVLHKLSWLSQRYVGSFEPIQELANRIADGKRVFFKSDEEKNEVMEVVKKMKAERAEELTERKGKEVAPEESVFETLTESERMDLFGSVIAGQYGAADASKDKGDDIQAVAQRNLKNNETYSGAQQEQFMGALAKALP